MSAGRSLVLGLSLLLLFSCEAGGQKREFGFALPSSLKEVSGLAAAGPESVFAHNDEHAIIYEIRITDGHVGRVFALGDPTIEGDFEGIASADGEVFLLTSDGLIYSARPGEHRERVAYRVFDSGIGTRCEAEGLSQAPEAGDLLILCKRLRDGAGEPRLEIHRWTIGSERAEDEPWLSLPLDGLVASEEQAEFRPSGIEWDGEAGQVLVVSARNRMVLAFNRQGQLVSRRRLDHGRHPKTEGIAVLPGRRLVLADEGSATRKGRIAAYTMP